MFASHHLFQPFEFKRVASFVGTLCVLFGLCWEVGWGQNTLHGTLHQGAEPVAGATIVLPELASGTITDADGHFHFDSLPSGQHWLEVQTAEGTQLRQRVTIPMLNPTGLRLSISDYGTNVQVITGTMAPVLRSESPVAVEVLTTAHLRANPSATVFEALQNVNGVRPQLNCAVCNTGDIHINGMEGPYTMMTLDGMPLMGGLATVYGLFGIPNGMIERVEVVKGPASSLYGSEAVGGLINIQTRTPQTAPRLLLDAFGTSWGELNVDAGTAGKIGKGHYLLSGNYFRYGTPLDRNGDGFTDLTLQHRGGVFMRYAVPFANGENLRLGVRVLAEDRYGGQMDFTPELRGSDSLYGEHIQTRRGEFFWAAPFRLGRTLYTAAGALSGHLQDSYYGTTAYVAKQYIGFAQITGTHSWSERHNTLHGIATRYTYYDDNTVATAEISGINRPDAAPLPGAFIQHEWKPSPKHTLLLGGRLDWDSRHGFIPTPRAAWKWAPSPLHTLRLNAGSGFRVVNLFTEEHAALTGSRRTVLSERLRPERTWSSNLDYITYITLGRHLLSVNLNLFANYFTNKILPDYESDPEIIRYANLDGFALYAGGALTVEWNSGGPLYARAGFTLLNARTHTPTNVVEPYLTEWANGSWLVAWRIQRWNLRIEYTGNLVGPMRLPTFANDPRPSRSPWHSIQNIQITKSFANLGIEIYGGVKNLLNFRPAANSILRAHDPFDRTAADPISNPNGHTFDTAYVFASFQGIRGFLGARYTLGR